MNHWIAVSSNIDRRIATDSTARKSWWCFPLRASLGDSVLFYLPRSVNQSRHGVYAVYEIASEIDLKHAKNHYCSAYRAKHEALKYAEVRPLNHFNKALSCKAMKESALKDAAFVRRNFQGTIFEISPDQFQLVVRMLKAINEQES